ncbi:helix-turn-helix domain-containing protein [bacterium]|nr:helix-turn-helix domain-containing protein [bacterium]
MIINRLSEIMGIKRLKSKDILSITTISRKTLYNIYNDKTNGIEFETLDQLCFALDCTPNDLFRYVPNSP